MTLAQRASKPPAAMFGLPCSVGDLLKTLPKAEAKALKEMLDAPWRVWRHVDIERAVRDEGYTVGKGTVGKHRRRECRCDDTQ